MKTLILIMAFVGFSFSAFARGPEIMSITNQKQVERSINNGWVPAFGVKTRVKRWNGLNDIHPRRITFKYEKIRVRGAKFSSYDEAMTALEYKVSLIRTGVVYPVMSKKNVLKECGIKGMSTRRPKFEVVEELFRMGYAVANNFYIDDKEIDQDFNTVYRPYFTIALPCKFKR